MTPGLPSAAGHDLGDVISCFPFDTRAALQVAWLRRMVAIAAGMSGLWLGFVASHWVHWLFASAAGAAAVGWLRVANRTQGEARSKQAWQLAIRERGLERIHDAEVVRVHWHELLDMDVDEERLVLRLWRAQGPPLEIEPLYRSGGLDGLHAAMRRAFGHYLAVHDPQRSAAATPPNTRRPRGDGDSSSPGPEVTTPGRSA